MILVALDNSRPTSREDRSWGAWVGDGRNRWYDKHHRMCVFVPTWDAINTYPRLLCSHRVG